MKSKLDKEITATPPANVTQPSSTPEKLQPKSGPIAKIKSQKDTIPLLKTPKRQKSSRFHIAEKVELEKLPPFKGYFINRCSTI